MADQNDRLTEAERRFLQTVAYEESGRVTPEYPDLPDYVPLPTAPGDVVVEIVPTVRTRRKTRQR